MNCVNIWLVVLNENCCVFLFFFSLYIFVGLSLGELMQPQKHRCYLLNLIGGDGEGVGSECSVVMAVKSGCEKMRCAPTVT